MVSIIDYGMGNLRSVQNALAFLGCDSRVINKPQEVLDSSRLLLPGVGAFDKAMLRLTESDLIEPLNKVVLSYGMPIMGICLGMQLLASKSEEGDPIKGLSFIKGEVQKFSPSSKFKVPLMGFNDVSIKNREHKLFKEISDKSDFYFVHSYHMLPANTEDVLATSFHGVEFVSAVARENIYGTQFHPEKSQSNGLKLLANFIKIS